MKNLILARKCGWCDNALIFLLLHTYMIGMLSDDGKLAGCPDIAWIEKVTDILVSVLGYKSTYGWIDYIWQGVMDLKFFYMFFILLIGLTIYIHLGLEAFGKKSYMKYIIRVLMLIFITM